MTPDFYISNGTGAHDLLKTRRACWKTDIVTARDGTRVQLLRIDPPISEEPPLPAEVMRDTVGLFQQVKMSVFTADGLKPMPSGKADFWVIGDIEGHIIPLACIGVVDVEAA